MTSLITFRYEIYRFLQAITILNPYLALYHRNRIKDIVIDPADPYAVLRDINNPYYHNLRGDYYICPDDNYPELSDTPIYFTPIEHIPANGYSYTDIDGAIVDVDVANDNDVRVLLSKETLAYFSKSKHALKHSASYKHKLDIRYPDQVDLIKNILYPVEILDDITNEDIIEEKVALGKLVFAIGQDGAGSGDGPILVKGMLLNNLPFSMVKFPIDILPEYELVSVIEAIRTFLQMFEKRWVVNEFVQFEEATSVLYDTIIWSVLPMVILNQRIDNMHTASVHSDLLWLYLESHGLARYQSIFNRTQQLFLYRNIRYLFHIEGTSRALNILTDNLLGDFNTTIYADSILLSAAANTTNSLPVPQAINSKILNDHFDIATNSTGIRSVTSLYAAAVEEGLEPGDGPDLLTEQIDTLSKASVSKLPTKLLKFGGAGSSSNISSYYDKMYLEFAIESFLYIYSRRKLDDLPSIIIGDEYASGGALLTIHDAIRLLFYLVHASNTVERVLSDNELATYATNNVMVVLDGRFVVVTNDNVDTMRGITIGILPLDTIPTKVNVTKPFRLSDDAFDISFDEHKYLSDMEQQYADLMRINDTYAEDRVFNINNIVESDDVGSILNTMFALRLADHSNIVSGSRLSECLGFYGIEAATNIHGIIDLTSNDAGAFDYESYKEWLTESPDIRSLLENILTYEDSRFKFSELTGDVLNGFTNMLESEFVNVNSVSTYKMDLIQSLFVQLSSYDVTFYREGDERSFFEETPRTIIDDTGAVVVPMIGLVSEVNTYDDELHDVVSKLVYITNSFRDYVSISNKSGPTQYDGTYNYDGSVKYADIDYITNNGIALGDEFTVATEHMFTASTFTDRVRVCAYTSLSYNGQVGYTGSPSYIGNSTIDNVSDEVLALSDSAVSAFGKASDNVYATSNLSNLQEQIVLNEKNPQGRTIGITDTMMVTSPDTMIDGTYFDDDGIILDNI